MNDSIAEYYPMSTLPPRTHDHHSDTTKEVVYDQTKQVYAEPHYGGLEVDSYQHVTSDRSPEKHLPRDDTKAPRWSRKRKMMLLWTGGILTVLIIIVVAVVLATTLPKKNGGSTKDAPNDSRPSGNTTANTIAANSIAANSSLATTAWIVDSKSGSYVLRLIHQNADGQLQSSLFNSTSGKWSKVPNFTRAVAGSTLTLTTFNQSSYNDHHDMQQELFFLDNAELREWNWDTSALSVSSAGSGGGANKKHFPTHPSSQISASWPFIIYQGPDRDLMELVYNGWDVSATNTNDWTIPVFEGGAIQIVPVQQALTKMGIFYQQEDLSMVLYERINDGNDPRNGIYAKDANFTTPPLPPKAALAAFSLPGDDEAAYSFLKTYTLYQDSDAKIQMMWRNDNSSGWRGPKTFPAFEGANNGTSLACVTMFSYPGMPMEKWTVPRCFFVAGNNITQVKMVDEDWKVVGTVGVDER